MTGWRLTLLVLVAALAAAGCGDSGSGPGGGEAAPVPSTAPPTTVASLDGCITADEAELIEIDGPADGDRFDAAILGDGEVGVVVSNQSDDDTCPWEPLARELVDRGYLVLLHRYSHIAPAAGDAAAAAAELRKRGASKVVLLGASLGGTASVQAGGEIEPPVAGVISLSGGGDELPAAAPELRVPVLLVATELERGIVAANQDAYEAAKDAPARDLVVLDGADHGVALLEGEHAERTRSLIFDFLEQHAGT